MTNRISMASAARRIALLVAVGLLASLASATASMAGVPGGTACNSTDGKISGRGSTFQNNAQTAFIGSYENDICGSVALEFAGDPAGNTMIAYNYPAAANNGSTGSGQGQQAMSCRTDAFAGSDIPYVKATLTTLNGAPAGLNATNPCTLNAGFSPPYTPSGPTFPAAADATKNMMSFPIAGSAVALGINLKATASCPTPPTSLTLTMAQVSEIYAGEISNWDDPALSSNNPGLSGCDKALFRVVRPDATHVPPSGDKSGTTQTFKNSLARADGARTLCDGSSTWTVLDQDANNEVWPTGGTCASNILEASATGGGNLINVVVANDGAIGYADYSDWMSKATGLPLASLVAQDGTTVTTPNNGSNANCSFTGDKLAGGQTPTEAVGLNTSSGNDKTWANDATAANNRSNVTYEGSGYPICGFTWDFVYTGLSGAAGTGAVSGLTNDQRRTLYSYFSYVLTPVGQAALANKGYAQLPAVWLPTLRSGFQSNF